MDKREKILTFKIILAIRELGSWFGKFRIPIFDFWYLIQDSDLGLWFRILILDSGFWFLISNSDLGFQNLISETGFWFLIKNSQDFFVNRKLIERSLESSDEEERLQVKMSRNNRFKFRVRWHFHYSSSVSTKGLNCTSEFTLSSKLGWFIWT